MMAAVALFLMGTIAGLIGWVIRDEMRDEQKRRGEVERLTRVR